MDKKYIEAIKFVSQEFWGEPTLKNDDEWRFGNKLSKAVNLKDATYFDFEENEGGGLIDLFIYVSVSLMELRFGMSVAQLGDNGVTKSLTLLTTH